MTDPANIHTTWWRNIYSLWWNHPSTHNMIGLPCNQHTHNVISPPTHIIYSHNETSYLPYIHMTWWGLPLTQCTHNMMEPPNHTSTQNMMSHPTYPTCTHIMRTFMYPKYIQCDGPFDPMYTQRLTNNVGMKLLNHV